MTLVPSDSTGRPWMGYPLHVLAPVFFDIETTGLRPDRGAKIVEMAVVAGERVLYHWPGEDDAALDDALVRLFHHLRDSVVVGHNLAFDFHFVAYEAERYTLEGPAVHYIDTLALARRLLPSAPDHQLATLLHICGLPVPTDLHTACADARATQALFWRLVDEGGLATIGEAGLKRLHWGTS